MFSNNQLIFALCFIVVFVAAMIYSYRKDLKMNKYFYKGSYWVLIAFILFIGLLFVIKTFLKD